MELQARNATLSDLGKILMDQHARKHDIVVPAGRIRSISGNLSVLGDGSFTPTALCDGGIADKLNVPVNYLRRMRAERVDLYDANVNGWLQGSPATLADDDLDGGAGVQFVPGSGPDRRSFLLRTFKGEDGGDGIARAFLSQNFKIIDNLDSLTAALDGIRDAGVKVQIAGADLTETRMTVRVVCPEVAAFAPVLLDGYRNPFAGDGHGQAGLRRLGESDQIARDINAAAQAHGWTEDLPVVFAGFEISNSETGGGAFSITPRLVVQVCTNGMKITKDALRSVHLGAKMGDGVVRWSEDTIKANLTLVTKQARDAVRDFLDIEYVKGVIADIEAKAGAPVTDPNATIQNVGKELRFSDEKIRDTLNAFILGGQMTAGGVLNAVTAAVQTVADADEAYDIEAQAMRVLELAATA